VKQYSTVPPVSYLAVVKDLQQIKVHCPVCLMSSLSHALIGGLADKGANLKTTATIASALAEVERVLNLMNEGEIERASTLLVGYLMEALEQHRVDLPF
jgi:hypothetical protein